MEFTYNDLVQYHNLEEIFKMDGSIEYNGVSYSIDDIDKLQGILDREQSEKGKAFEKRITQSDEERTNDKQLKLNKNLSDSKKIIDLDKSKG